MEPLWAVVVYVLSPLRVIILLPMGFLIWFGRGTTSVTEQGLATGAAAAAQPTGKSSTVERELGGGRQSMGGMEEEEP